MDKSVLLPLALVGSLILILQTIAQGPAAALEFIKKLGTNVGWLSLCFPRRSPSRSAA
jgi:K+-transporting ATPase A subunit